ncbi:50S ribosomal protein L13 [Candidatus Peregrinibacteria bacterium]|nr:50S ribosomal protein L13 [Candidatus Peregrinibacteria bacterium]
MKTYTPKKSDIKQNWYIIDAKDRILGRLATTVANKLRGKDKPVFSPHIDCGDFIIVINADKIKLTGEKKYNKTYYHHSGYPGGLKEEKITQIKEKNPTKVLELAVKGMLPKNRLRKNLMKKLKIYSEEEHPHKAQNPQPLEV